MVLVRFDGARVVTGDDGEKQYERIGDIWINPERVSAVYGHKIVCGDSVFVVAQTGDTIAGKLRGAWLNMDGAVEHKMHTTTSSEQEKQKLSRS